MGKGQVSFEYLFVVGFTFLLLTPLIVLYSQTQKDSSDSLIEAQARNAASAIRDAAERVYIAGPAARETIDVVFPDGVIATNLTNTSIILTMRGGSGWYDLLIPSAAPLNGSLQTFHGRHVVRLENNGTLVQVFG